MIARIVARVVAYVVAILLILAALHFYFQLSSGPSL